LALLLLRVEPCREPRWSYPCQVAGVPGFVGVIVGVIVAVVGVIVAGVIAAVVGVIVGLAPAGSPLTPASR
jgi:hypothetical protein